jgi:hypothetical protein
VSKKITVIAERRQVKKTAAEAMVRARGYGWVEEGVSIIASPIREFRTNLPPRLPATTPRLPRANYEHHIEPRLEHFGVADTEWLAYLNGY